MSRLQIHGPESDVAYARGCYALAEQLGLGSSCVFRGPTADVGQALNEGDIAVLSSISEGFPFAAVEALMAGRPMVATEVGGVPEVIDPALRHGWFRRGVRWNWPTASVPWPPTAPAWPDWANSVARPCWSPTPLTCSSTAIRWL